MMMAALGVHSSTLPPEHVNGNHHNLHLFCLPLSSSSTHFPIKHHPVTFENGVRPISLSCSASRSWKGKTKGGDPLVLDDEDDEEEEEEDEEEEEEEEEGEEGMLAFDKMRAWLRNKPVGFGEGKSYDVSLEEQLAQEIEQSRKAQILNVSTLKNSVKKQSKENEVNPNASRVRIGNLPRKKNIHRDLKLAFAEFRGILKISPAVSGNEKTRDPICKGFAFIEFQSEGVADRFVRAHSNQSLKFGNVEKRITCHLLNPSSPLATSRRPPSDSEVVSTAEEIDATSLAFGEDNQGSVGNERCNLEKENQRLGSLILPSQGTENEVQTGEPSVDISISEESCERRDSGELVTRRSTSSQGKESRRRKDKVKPRKDLNPTIPGSATRLKVKERAALSGVFSKYGSKVALGLAKEN